jgi:hypothetical protein
MARTRTILGLLLVALPLGAAARNMGQFQASPEIEQWVQNLKDDQGHGCCATADGYPTEAVWDTGRNGYRVKINDQWFAVPAAAVLKAPNRLGYAVVWYTGDEDGEVVIRCFLPGADT